MGNTLPSQTMASQLYDPDTDRRDCALARYFPHESISNVDMSGITVGVASESWLHYEHLLLCHELTGPSCCRYLLFA